MGYSKKTDEKILECNRNYYKRNREKLVQKKREYRQTKKEKIKEYSRAYYAKNKTRILKQRAENYEENKEKLIRRAISWAKDNVEKHRASSNKSAKRPIGRAKKRARAAKRQASQLNATPSWLTKEHYLQIQNIYKEAKRLEDMDGIKRHVDHIIPLQGNNVRGLHVPWNLQILTAEENMRKNNKVIPNGDLNG